MLNEIMCNVNSFCIKCNQSAFMFANCLRKETKEGSAVCFQHFSLASNISLAMKLRIFKSWIKFQNGNWGNCKCLMGYVTVLQFCAEFWFLSTAGTFLGFCQRLFAGWSSNVPLSFVVFVALFIQCASFLLQCYLAPNIVSYCGSSKHKDYRRTKLCKLSLLLEKHHRHGVGAIDFYTTV